MCYERLIPFLNRYKCNKKGNEGPKTLDFTNIHLILQPVNIESINCTYDHYFKRTGRWSRANASIRGNGQWAPSLLSADTHAPVQKLTNKSPAEHGRNRWASDNSQTEWFLRRMARHQYSPHPIDNRLKRNFYRILLNKKSISRRSRMRNVIFDYRRRSNR